MGKRKKSRWREKEAPLRCRRGHAVCGRCSYCHHCWGLGEVRCEVTERLIEAIEEGELDMQFLFEKDLIDVFEGIKLSKKERAAMRDWVDQNGGSLLSYDEGEVEFDAVLKCTVTKVGRHQVYWRHDLKKYVLVLGTTTLVEKAKGWVSGGSGTAGYGTQTTWRTCKHKGDTEVVNVDGVSFRCAKGWDLEAGPVDLVIDCANSQSQQRFVYGNDKYADLNQYVRTNPVVKLDWKDQGIPPVGLTFWQEFWRKLPKPGKVVICCMGAHGRTGTCLASFLIVSGRCKTAADAIALVRANHCSEAVESKAQVTYLCYLAEKAWPGGGANDAPTPAPVGSNEIVDASLVM